MTQDTFEDLRPYTDQEIPAAMQRIANSDAFPLLASYIYPDEPLQTVRQRICAYTTVHDFQMELMRDVNRRIISNSITSFTYQGIEDLDPKASYLYVCNHRDIMLDSSLMQYALYQHGFDTTEITFGANLMQGQLVIDIGKSNKMFRVERPGASVREFYMASHRLSSYIRHVITNKRQSVWIAQRNGRTKDGIDRTDQGLLKMFSMSMQADKVQALDTLHIVPVSISYEWEPCDVLKTLELYARRMGPYTKKPGEDLNSILTGIVQPKGQVNITFCRPLTTDELMERSQCTSTEFHRKVAELIDQRICTAYRLMPTNYLAHDLLYADSRYVEHYTPELKQQFKTRIEELVKYQETANVEELMHIMLGIYASPVDSMLAYTAQSEK